MLPSPAARASRSVAVYGGSFNPPGIHHQRIVRALAAQFDEVIVIPCGPRPDKATTNDVDPVHRAWMVDRTFRDIPRVRVELFDLEQATFTRTHALDERLRGEGELWHVVTGELVRGGGSGRSFIHREWEQGAAIWSRCNFAILVDDSNDSIDALPAGPAIESAADLPPRHRLVGAGARGSSAGIRERAFRHESISGLVTPEVERYIERYSLYRGRLLQRATRLALVEPRLSLLVDERNPRAVEIAARLHATGRVDEQHAELLVVVGGDGTMVRAIRTHWRRRLPFFGINAGHRGFLLNAVTPDRPDQLPPLHDLVAHQLPLLYAETLGKDGQWRDSMAFNDAWVMCTTGQSAWVEVSVNGAVRIPRLIGDGVLLSTAAGSTAYARSMGATPLLVGTPALILVGSNIGDPPHWKSAYLSLDASVELRSLDPDKRPLTAFVDGFSHGEVLSMRLRTSRIAAVEIAFLPGHDLAAKLAELQFPT